MTSGICSLSCRYGAASSFLTSWAVVIGVPFSSKQSPVRLRGALMTVAGECQRRRSALAVPCASVDSPQDQPPDPRPGWTITHMFLHRSAPGSALRSAASPWIETRPMRPDDRDGLAQLFARLSPESRYRRFFELKRELKPRELDWLTAIDHVDHEAVVAVDQHDGSLIGVGRYVREKD